MQTTGPGCHHQTLQEHAVIEQTAAAHDFVEGEDQAHRCPKKSEVLLALQMHFFFIALAYSQHTVQTKATLTASVDIGAHPFAWVVVVFFCMLSGQCRIGSHGIVRFTNFAHQFVFGGALQHINFPRLCVGATG